MGVAASTMDRHIVSRATCLRLIAGLAAALLTQGCSAGDSQGATIGREDSAYQTRWLDTSGLGETGFGRISFWTRDRKALDALTFRSSGFDGATGPIWFVMHGASRDVERYIRAAAPAAERNNALAIAVHFPKYMYPSSSDYTLGITTEGRADARAGRQGRYRSPELYLYAEIEYLFDAVRQFTGGEQDGYYLFGHSAGAQFAHRLATFLREPRTIAAVAANAGWYTMPVAAERPEYTMPYGLNRAPDGSQDLTSLFEVPLSVMLGERDTTTPATDRLVRGTPEAMVQGQHRLARGQFYFDSAREQASALDRPFNWRLAIVPRAGHDAAQMIDSAAHHLFQRDEAPCTPGPAPDNSDIRFSEILADPPAGSDGDANGDGVRDPADDEFVEIVNVGTQAVCLAGWALGDADNPERHVFPLGSELRPGAAIVVFGGGVPTGEFGRAATLTAAFDGRLSLSNKGDVLSLRDIDDAIVTQLSWGDCGGRDCTPDHFPAHLGINASLTRRPASETTWTRHDVGGGLLFSPGLRSDGSDL